MCREGVEVDWCEVLDCREGGLVVVGAGFLLADLLLSLSWNDGGLGVVSGAEGAMLLKLVMLVSEPFTRVVNSF